MSWLSVHDLFIPTNPLAAVFFGVIFAIITGFYVWFDTKELKVSIFSSLFATVVVVVLVGILYMFGYYG